MLPIFNAKLTKSRSIPEGSVPIQLLEELSIARQSKQATQNGTAAPINGEILKRKRSTGEADEPPGKKKTVSSNGDAGDAGGVVMVPDNGAILIN